jgi:dihydrolipoamide dehydrogenase
MDETGGGARTRSVRAVDVAILGAGTAGMAAYRAVRKHGKTALLIEANTYGTTCARVGCMPSKLLIAAAEAAHHANEAAPFGVTATVKVDGRAVMDRVRRERDRFVGFVIETVEGFPPDDRLLGHARFVSPTELDVVGPGPESRDGARTRVTARAFVIATGSSPVVPAMFDKIRDRLVVNDHVFEWDDLPESVAVFGAGVIGLELGQALHRLGVRVRIFGRSGTVGPLGDPAVKAAAARALTSELAVDFDAKVHSVEPGRGGEDTTKGATVRFVDASGAERTEHFAAVLVAAGRRPNAAGLGLEHVGVDASAPIDRTTLQLGTSNVFMAGDVRDDAPLLHEAADEGALAGENAATFPDVHRGERRTGLAISFTAPALAVVGGGWAALAQSRGGRPVVVGEVDFGEQGRSRIMLQNRGLARLYMDPTTRRFLGAELAAPRGEHLAHLLAWAHQAGLTIDQMLAMPFYHPVVEEGLRTALRDAVAKASQGVTARAGR